MTDFLVMCQWGDHSELVTVAARTGAEAKRIVRSWLNAPDSCYIFPDEEHDNTLARMEDELRELVTR